MRWYTPLEVQWYTPLEVRWYTPLGVQWYTSLGVPVYTSYRVRVHTLLGTEVLPRSVQGDCPERCEADRMNRSYRHNLVYCPLQVWLGGREISLKDLTKSPPTRVLTKVKTRIKTLGTKHPLRRTNPGFQRAEPFGRAGRREWV